MIELVLDKLNGDSQARARPRKVPDGATAPVSEYEESVVLASARGGELMIVFPRNGATPPWLMPTIGRLAEVLKLPENWNSYRARSVDPASAAAALELLASVMQANTPAPLLVPTVRGGLQLEWHTRGVDLEVEPLSAGRASVFVEDQISGEQWEKELEGTSPP